MTPNTEPDQAVEEIVDKLEDLPTASVNFNGQTRPRRASTTLISESPADIQRLLGSGETATKLISQCCGGGCCLLKTLQPDTSASSFVPVVIPDNAAEKPDQGEVLAVGPGKRNDKGELSALTVRVGDRVLFGKYSGQTVKVDGDELLVMREEDLFAVVEK